LGTGSMNTISRHLQTWRESRPATAAVAFEMPAELVTAFGKELRRGADQAAAALQAELLEARVEVHDLAATGEDLESEREALAVQVVELTTARDQAEATAKERAAEISRLSELVTREQQAAEAARVEFAKASLKLEGQTEKLDELRQDLATVRVELSQAEKARVTAEQVAAVAQSQVQAETRRADQAEARERVASDAASKAQEALSAALTKSSATLADAERRAGSAEAKAGALAGQIDDLRASLNLAQSKIEKSAVVQPSQLTDNAESK
jgi:colicin import membrane protein